jgi:hypothetical protein
MKTKQIPYWKNLNEKNVFQRLIVSSFQLSWEEYGFDPQKGICKLNLQRGL